MKKQKVFIAEDNPQYRFLLEAKLGAEFETVHSFISGEAMLAALHENPDVILLDHHFEGGKNGLDLLPEIMQALPEVKVIFLTGQSKVQVAVEALKRGAFDYVEKGPAEMEDLSQVLARLQPATRPTPWLPFKTLFSFTL